MSRIGKKPLLIPQGIEFIEEGDKIILKNKSESLEVPKFPYLKIIKEGNTVRIERQNDEKQTKAWHGLLRRLLENAVVGLTQGYKKELDIMGTGYRAEIKGDSIIFNLGYSHPINFPIPKGIKVSYEAKQNRLTLVSANKELLTQTAAKIKELRPPDPYKGKGIKYADEVLHLKPGKTGA